MASDPWLKAVKVSVSPRDLVGLDLSRDRSCFIFESWVWVFFSAEEDTGTEAFFARAPENTAQFQRQSGGFAWVNPDEE